MVILEQSVLSQSLGEESPPSPGSSVLWSSITHRGMVRSENEDALCIEIGVQGSEPSRYLFAVADGLGGHQAGATASRLALKVIQEEFRQWPGGAKDRFVSKAMRYANQQVYSAANSTPELFKMQTTLTTVVLEQDSLTIGHVGDCRLYKVRGGRIELLTRDHSLANDLLQLHLITPEQAWQHPGRHQLTRSVGADLFLRIDLIRQQVEPGDTYLLCSDGLWSEVAPENIRETIQKNDINSACEEFVELVLKAGAPDNISGIIFRINKVQKQPSSSFSWRTILGRIS